MRSGWIHVWALLMVGASIAGCNGSTCASSRDCSGSGQVCDFDRGVCVECVTFVDCLSAGQICASNRCVTPTPCTSSRECTDQVCDVALSHCVDCLTATDCSVGQRCSAGSCVSGPKSCVADRDCSASGQHCDTVAARCVDCVRAADCSGGEVCQANVCVAVGIDGGPRDGGVPFDAGPRDAGARDAGGRDAGGPSDAGPLRDASSDPCAVDEPLEMTTSGCHGGQGLFATALPNTFGGTCTVPDEPGPGTCVGANAFCVDYALENDIGICVRPCVPSAATDVSTGDCPVGARCFAYGDPEGMCVPDCSMGSHCATTSCAGDGSCIDI